MCDPYLETDEEKFLLCDDCRRLKNGEGQDSGEKAKDLLREKLTLMKWEELKNLTQQKENMIVSCSFMGKTCSAK